MNPLHRAFRSSSCALVLGIACAAVGCQPTKAFRVREQQQRELGTLTSMMLGAFSSTAQAAADPDYFDIRLHMTRIWPDLNPDTERWLYVEQAMATALDTPYRQRIYRVAPRPKAGVAPGVSGVWAEFQSEVYELPGEASSYAGAWRDTGKLAGLTPASLRVKDGCEVMLTRKLEGASASTVPGPVFEGGTVGNNCASVLRGAAYASSQVRIDLGGLTTWDRGYDASGMQVWGAVKGGYRFEREAIK